MANNPPAGKHPATRATQGVLASLTAAQTGTYDALVRGTRDYWANFMARGASPVEVPIDLLKWWGTALRRERPQWATPHQVVAEWSIARLRDFSDHDAPESVPTILLPPHAGHDSCIVDFATDQSQVRTALGAGHTRVYSLDWTGATPETKHSSITTYISVIEQAVDRVGGLANIVGDGQGGWLAAIYAALHPQTVHSLAVAGSPIDYHAGEPLIHDWLRGLTPGYNLGFYRNLVAANGGVLPGDFLLAGFMGMQPHNELSRQLQLLANINNQEHVDRYRRFETWFQWTQNIPGDFYLWIIEHLFQKNQLVKGLLVVGGRPVDLARITAPLYLVAGSEDHITPPEQVWALADHVSTPQDQVMKRTASGGHLGMFMGHEALAEHWTPVFRDMIERSGSADRAPRPGKGSAEAAPAGPTSPEGRPAGERGRSASAKSSGAAKRTGPQRKASRRAATVASPSTGARTSGAGTSAPKAAGSAAAGSPSRTRAGAPGAKATSGKSPTVRSRAAATGTRQAATRTSKAVTKRTGEEGKPPSADPPSGS